VNVHSECDRGFVVLPFNVESSSDSLETELSPAGCESSFPTGDAEADGAIPSVTFRLFSSASGASTAAGPFPLSVLSSPDEPSASLRSDGPFETSNRSPASPPPQTGTPSSCEDFMFSIRRQWLRERTSTCTKVRDQDRGLPLRPRRGERSGDSIPVLDASAPGSIQSIEQ
jgi:hypothetical protein